MIKIKSNIYILVLPTVQKDSERSFGYVLEANGKTVEVFGSVSGSFHKATLDVLARALERYHSPSEITIHLNNPFVANAVNNNLYTWQQMDFQKANGKPLANKEEWIRIAELIKRHDIHASIESHEYEKWMRKEMEG